MPEIRKISIIDVICHTNLYKIHDFNLMHYIPVNSMQPTLPLDPNGLSGGQEISVFYETRNFITMFTRSSRWALS
jgi:hypothetical protein